MANRLGFTSRLHSVAVSLALGLLAVQASADDAGARSAEETAEAAATRQEILHTLQDVQRHYGADAVLMEGHLLTHAIRNGSILEATIAVSGVEERDGKRFLAFKLETGIIYNDREVVPPARTARAWTDIVEASLRKFHALNVPADGVVFLLGYAHKPYADEADLRAHLSEGHGDPEAAAFYLLLPDVSELIANHITAQQLVDRSVVLVNGTATHVILEPPDNKLIH